MSAISSTRECSSDHVPCSNRGQPNSATVCYDENGLFISASINGKAERIDGIDGLKWMMDIAQAMMALRHV